MTKIERFIESWPESFGRIVKDTFKKFYAEEISKKTAAKTLYRHIELALNRIEAEKANSQK